MFASEAESWTITYGFQEVTLKSSILSTLVSKEVVVVSSLDLISSKLLSSVFILFWATICIFIFLLKFLSLNQNIFWKRLYYRQTLGI